MQWEEWHGTWRYGSKGWWYQLNSYQFAIDQWNIDGKTYYFDNNGWMQTGWQKIYDQWYYFNKSGAAATGWQKINGVWYHFSDDGVMATGWNQTDPTWYYHDKSGAMVTGWQKINGKWYHFASSGAMNTNCWIGNYYLKSDGSMATNQWIGRYHVNADGLWDKTKSKNDSSAHINNAYDSQGKLKTFIGMRTGTFVGTDNSLNCTSASDKELAIDFKSYDPNTDTYTADISFLLHVCDFFSGPEHDRTTTLRDVEISQWTLLNGGFISIEQAYLNENNPSGTQRPVTVWSNGLDISTGQVEIAIHFSRERLVISGAWKDENDTYNLQLL